ncbi:hypothetical protein BJY16_006740 [Actinoplanes octamycinicus]|uniref:Uncharacterized protein n=1 Tax=Actinoplanes octamycinicus TaxID=135948 RepID=A0A7W7MAU4_9ACTN|nr:hypothetical protein [Actinoplanes octamycinicus]MBB4743281.1 hypothetical protein [Actinoplanes octamycinicus]GIE61795.1 hypothetical protein Aoc01nite_71970 [Actinoplanes octamycinicus]
MPDLTSAILPALVLAIWVPSWWRRTRGFRLRFALLAPVVCGLGFVMAAFLALTQGGGSCPGSCPGGAVQRWAAGADNPAPLVAWLGASSLLAFLVSVVLTVVTLIVEFVLLVRRDARAGRTGNGEAQPGADRAERVIWSER